MTQALTESHSFYSYLLLSLPLKTTVPHLFVFSPLSIFPSPPLFLSFALCCCKAFPWLAVINLPSRGAGSWLRASKRSYKAKTAIQKNRAAFLVSRAPRNSHSHCCSPQGKAAAHNNGRTLDAASHITPRLIFTRLDTRRHAGWHLWNFLSPSHSDSIFPLKNTHTHAALSQGGFWCFHLFFRIL